MPRLSDTEIQDRRERLAVIAEDAGVSSSDYDVLVAVFDEAIERGKERDYWMADSAAAWDKCEERRIAQEKAEQQVGE